MNKPQADVQTDPKAAAAVLTFSTLVEDDLNALLDQARLDGNYHAVNGYAAAGLMLMALKCLLANARSPGELILAVKMAERCVNQAVEAAALAHLLTLAGDSK